MKWKEMNTWMEAFGKYYTAGEMKNLKQDVQRSLLEGCLDQEVILSSHDILSEKIPAYNNTDIYQKRARKQVKDTVPGTQPPIQTSFSLVCPFLDGAHLCV